MSFTQRQETLISLRELSIVTEYLRVLRALEPLRSLAFACDGSTFDDIKKQRNKHTDINTHGWPRGVRTVSVEAGL